MTLGRTTIVAASFLAAGLGHAQRPGGYITVGKPMPAVNLRAPNGEEWTNSMLRGKPVVLVVLGYTMAPDFVQKQYAEALTLQAQVQDYAQVFVVFTDPLDRKTQLPFGSSDEILERINGLLATGDKPITLNSLPAVKLAVTFQWPKDGWYAGDMMLPGTPETLILDAKGGVHSMLVGWTNEKPDLETKQSWWSLYAVREVHKILGDVNTLRATAERISNVIAEHPELERTFYVNKFFALAAVDTPAASAYARTLAKGMFKADGPGLNEFAWTMVKDFGPLNNADYKLAAELALHAAEIETSTLDQADAFDTAGFAYFKDGQLDEAIRTERKALACVHSGVRVSSSKVREFTDRLAMFLKAKAAKS